MLVCLSSSENTPRLFELPSLYVNRRYSHNLCGEAGICLNMSLFFCRWNDKKAKMHYVLFCMPEISPSKLYLLRKGTDPNRFVGVMCELLYAFNLWL